MSDNRCFWAGTQARSKALKEENYITDTMHPIIGKLFNICSEIRVHNGHSEQLTLISYAISKAYASYSRGIVKIFISSDKLSESPCLTVGTNFWEAELPVLRHLERQNLVKLNVYLHIGDLISHTDCSVSSLETANRYWIGPFTHLSLPVVRRQWHPLDYGCRDSFVVQGMNQDDYDNWRSRPPRKYTSMAMLRKCVSKIMLKR